MNQPKNLLLMLWLLNLSTNVAKQDQMHLWNYIIIQFYKPSIEFSPYLNYLLEILQKDHQTIILIRDSMSLY
jgi:hypothetical protein